MNLKFHAPKKNCGNHHAFTLTELLAALAVLALLVLVFFPALANTQTDSRAFQCLNNQHQIMTAWRMYAEDNNDLLAPNDYPFETPFYPISLGPPAGQVPYRNWVVGTMEQPSDASQTTLLTNQSSVLSTYIKTPTPYKCPADDYIDPNAHRLHPRSISMNSAVGTCWHSSSTYSPGGPALGSPVPGGWLPGNAYNGNQTAWQTYGKFSAIVTPSPAKLFVIMDEHPLSINDGSIAFAAAAAPGSTYLIDYPAGYHNRGAGISFADGHSETHKWLDPRTYTPSGIIQPGQGSTGSTSQFPDNADSFYLASVVSAAR